MSDLDLLLAVANDAVDLAAELMRTRTPGALTTKGDRDTASETDFAIEHAVRSYLLQHTPDIGFLGEEEGAAGAPDGLTWALDPIDGTANFVHGIPLCGISLGLTDGITPIVGVLDFPFLQSRYTAAQHRGAYANGEPIHVSRRDQLHEAIVSIGDYAVGVNAERKNAQRLAVTAGLARSVERVRMNGSAALDFAWLAHGRLDALVILSNQPWDMAAGSILAREAGAAVVDKDGSNHTPKSSATIAANPLLLEPLLTLVQSVLGTL
jgi:myo-inositol-1(or 4)-monophosphatase